MPGSQTLTSRDLGHIVLSTTFSTEDRAGVLPSIEKSPLGMGTTTTTKKNLHCPGTGSWPQVLTCMGLPSALPLENLTVSWIPTKTKPAPLLQPILGL